MGIFSACSTTDKPTQSLQQSTSVPSEQTSILEPKPSTPTQLASPPEATSEKLPAIGTPTSASPDEVNSNQPEGEVSFQDKLAESDQVVFTTQKLSELNNQVYQAWLGAEDGSAISAGVLTLQPDGSASVEYTSPDGRPVLVNFTHFFVTREDTEQKIPGPQVVLSGELQPDLQQIARNLFVTNQGEPVTPRNKPSVQGMKEQFSLALQHIDNAINAQAINASAETRQHLEHVINILEGAQGVRFRDYTGDQIAQNPGDGFGVVQYIQQIAVFLHDPRLDDAANEVVNAIVALENSTIAILEQQNGAPALSEVKSQAVELDNNLMKPFYELVQQVFTIKLTPTP